MSISWPANLPQTVQLGYSESVSVNVLRTPTDSGPPKIRFRGKKPSTLSVSMLMSDTQVDSLNTFINNSSTQVPPGISGSLKFYFPHPRLGTVYCRFVPTSDGQFFTSEHVGLNFFKVSFTLEVVL